MHKKQMFIYISGPYGAASPEGVAANIQEANRVAIAIAQKGHVPFTPHKMMEGWEDKNHVARELVLNICLKWIDKCDALYFMGSSNGADQERAVAKKRAIPIYRNLEDIPDADSGSSQVLSENAMKCYLTEYQECMDSYRHTYATIWQAGSVCAAIAAGLIALVGKTSGGAIPWWVQVSVPALILAWWWCIFRPMNHYAEIRSTRLKALEVILNAGLPGLEMRHFTDYNLQRKDESGCVPFLKRLWWLRVSYGVTALCLLLLAVEAVLIRKHHHALLAVLKRLLVVNQ